MHLISRNLQLHKVCFTYNFNRIEGNLLSEKQVRHIYEGGLVISGASPVSFNNLLESRFHKSLPFSK